MWRVVHEVEAEMGVAGAPNTILQEMETLPSIGRLFLSVEVTGWLAQNYRAVSNSLFDGASDEAALALWKNEKRSPPRGVKTPRTGRAARGQ